MSEKNLPYLNVIRYIGDRDYPDLGVWSVQNANAYLQSLRNQGYVVKSAEIFDNVQKKGEQPRAYGIFYFLEYVGGDVVEEKPAKREVEQPESSEQYLMTE